MCKITSNELSGTGVHPLTLESFKAWFGATFGQRTVSAREVLAAYINHRGARRDAIDHLLGIQDHRAVLFDPGMNRRGTVRVDATLFIPVGTTVECNIHAVGINCAGDVRFERRVINEQMDIRVSGQMTVGALSCHRSSCISDSVVSNGDVYCDGDLLVDGRLICHGRLRCVGHLRASYIDVRAQAMAYSGLEVSDGVRVGDAFHHAGRLEVSSHLAIS